MTRFCAIIDMAQKCVMLIHQETLDPGDTTRPGVKSLGETYSLKTRKGLWQAHPKGWDGQRLPFMGI